MTSTTQNVGARLAPALHPQPYTLCLAPSALPKTCPQTPHPLSNIIEQFPPYSPQFTERPQTSHPIPKQYGAIPSLFAPN
jgi:hypothetical protein